MVKDKKSKKENNILYKNKKSIMIMRSAKMKFVREIANDSYGSLASVISYDKALLSDDISIRVMRVIREQFREQSIMNGVVTIGPRAPIDYPALELIELFIALENEFEITIGQQGYDLCPKIYQSGGCTFTVNDIINLVKQRRSITLKPGVLYGDLRMFLLKNESAPLDRRNMLVIFNHPNINNDYKRISTLDLTGYFSKLINISWSSLYSFPALKYIGYAYTFDSLTDQENFIKLFDDNAKHITVQDPGAIYYSPPVQCTVTSLQSCRLGTNGIENITKVGLFPDGILIKRTVIRSNYQETTYEIYADTLYQL